MRILNFDNRNVMGLSRAASQASMTFSFRRLLRLNAALVVVVVAACSVAADNALEDKRDRVKGCMTRYRE